MHLRQLNQTAHPLLFKMVLSSDGRTPATGKTPTVTLSKNGGAFASPAGAVTEIANGWYKVAGNATDCGTLGPLILNATAAASDTASTEYQVVAFDPDNAANLGLSDLSQCAGELPAGSRIAARGTIAGGGGNTPSLTFVSGAPEEANQYAGATIVFNDPGDASFNRSVRIRSHAAFGQSNPLSLVLEATMSPNTPPDAWYIINDSPSPFRSITNVGRSIVNQDT